MKRRASILILLLSFTAFAETRYPIVLTHGYMASDTLYSWQKIAFSLRLKGYQVFVPEVSAIDSVQVRGEQLGEQIQDILQLTGASKVNVIGHSMGGLDARYVISTRKDDSIATLTTLASPHWGSPAADFVDELIEKNGCTEICKLLQRLLPLFNESTSKADLASGVKSLTTTAMKQFNLDNPNVPGVYYQSWAASITHNKRAGRPWLRWLHDRLEPDDGRNDGLVPVASARWGRFRGTVTADHLGIIGVGLLQPRQPHKPTPFIHRILKELSQMGY